MGEAHSSGVMTVSLLMVAYFVYDLTFNKVGIEYIFHHSIVLVCIVIYYWCDTFVFYVAAGLMTEFSTVLLAISALLRKGSRTKAFVMIDFAITFFFCRIVLISTLLLMIWFNETGARYLIATTSFGVFGALNAYWFRLIVPKVAKVCGFDW